jgi:hypothetical protein
VYFPYYLRFKFKWVYFLYHLSFELKWVYFRIIWVLSLIPWNHSWYAHNQKIGKVNNIIYRLFENIHVDSSILILELLRQCGFCFKFSLNECIFCISWDLSLNEFIFCIIWVLSLNECIFCIIGDLRIIQETHSFKLKTQIIWKIHWLKLRKNTIN